MTHTLIQRELSALIASGIMRKLVLHRSLTIGRCGELAGSGGEIALIPLSAYTSLHSPHNLLRFSKWIDGPGRSSVSISHPSPRSGCHERGNQESY
jgi:hypothetical protein